MTTRMAQEVAEQPDAVRRTLAALLVVEALARHLGLDPDHPRGLAQVTSTDRD